MFEEYERRQNFETVGILVTNGEVTNNIVMEVANLHVSRATDKEKQKPTVDAPSNYC